jgi:hypothetical protein
MSALAKYLIRTTLIGGVVGVAHGATSLPADMPNRSIKIAMQAQLCGMMAPWSPVLGALVLQGTLSPKTLLEITDRAQECPFVRPPPPPAGAMAPPDLPTVAEAR